MACPSVNELDPKTRCGLLGPKTPYSSRVTTALIRPDPEPVEYATGSRALSWLAAGMSVALVVTVFAILDRAVIHWFLLPTAGCGLLWGVDVVDWLRGRFDTLNPRALVAVFGYYLMFIAPLLHVVLDYWPRYVEPAQDWYWALGVLGVVNLAGLCIYRVVMAPTPGPVKPPKLEIRPERFVRFAIAGALVSALAFVFVVISFGGPSGYLSTITSNRDELAGAGWMLLLGEAWPLLLLAAILVGKRDWLRSNTLALVTLLVGFVLLQFFVGGLRGSRSNTVWPALIALGMTHLLVREVRRRVVVLVAVLLVVFAWLYGFYKGAGTEAVGVVSGETSIGELSRTTGRGIDLVLLEDFGRAGTQALVIDRLSRGDVAPAGGETYIGAFNFLLPDGASPVQNKNQLGTDVLYGSGTYASGFESSRIYGLIGEGILNFGSMWAAWVFLPFAVTVRLVERLHARGRRFSGLALGVLTPVFTSALVLLLASDLDNTLWFLLNNFLPLALVVWLSKVQVNSNVRTRQRD